MIVLRDERGALHFEILHALPGRLRVRLEKPVESDEIFRSAPGLLRCSYNQRIRSLLIEYDPNAVSEDDLIVHLAGLYAVEKQTKLLHIKRSEEKGFSMGPTGGMALAMIGLDGLMKLTGAQLAGFSGWFSTGATLAAVVEHGYQELQTRGSFDPEVMSIIYLINSIGKTNTFQASLLAWVVTFGRHLVPKAPREQVYLVRQGDHSATLIPLKGKRTGSDYAGKMLRRGSELLAK